jgi:VIT1/CCC1 family predicted Fe2+/Mn2+ transporter
MEDSVKDELCRQRRRLLAEPRRLRRALCPGAAVVGGVLTIAVADACSDALGIHISEEGEHVRSPSEIWHATVATFVSKFFMALTFLIPVWFCELATAIAVSVAWGLTVIMLLSYQLAQSQGGQPGKAICEHLTIAVLMLVLTHALGDRVRQMFG